MDKKVIFLLVLTILALGCWFLATLFGGFSNLVPIGALAGAVVLIGYILIQVTRRINPKIWIFAGFLLLIGLFLPASFYLKVIPAGGSEPFSTPVALAQLFIISAALLVTALLVNSGLTSYLDKFYSQPNEGSSSETWMWIVFILSLLLLAKAFHSFYWFLVWDSTTDPLGIFWLPIPLFTVIFASFILFLTRSGEAKTTGLLNLLLIPALIAIFVLNQKVDFRQLTEDRAAHISLAIERYYAEKSHYPQELGQLFPWDLLAIPVPVIIYGQDWCYDSSEDYYRLGYVYRQHWSDPRLTGKIYTFQGDVPRLPQLCEAETTALQQTYPDYPYEYLDDGE